MHELLYRYLFCLFIIKLYNLNIHRYIQNHNPQFSCGEVLGVEEGGGVIGLKMFQYG